MERRYSWTVCDGAAEANEHRIKIAGCVTVSIAARLREVPSQARASYVTDTDEADVHRTSVMKQRTSVRTCDVGHFPLNLLNL
jgi:hypothetical protein